ncbi:MAG: hypothetical protein C4522_01655 [Desulfobacteraceae bacterium]|nr:MAG: hypothetical protein C4522_01655 [Desulfobacteraceae bacterium]
MDIHKTLIGTAVNPTISGGVNLYEYLHFPNDWSKSVSITAWDVGSDFDIKVLEGKINTRAAFAIDFGLAGPNWAGRMFVEGSASADEIRLDVLEDDFKAGMLLGIGFNPQLALNLQAYTWQFRKWHWPQKEWNTICNFSIDKTFDLVGFLYNQIIKPWLIDGIKDLEDEIPLAFIHLLVDLIPSASPNLIANNNNIIDYVAADGADAGWTWQGLVMSPDLNFQWDLIEMAVALAETIALIPPVTEFGEAAAVVDSTTKWLRPKVTSGPVVGVVLNVHLKISGITAFVDDTATVTTKNIRTDGVSVVADIDTGSEHIESINRIGVEFTHRAGITFEVGWHTGLFWLKILGYDFKKMYNATDLIDIAEIPISEQYRYRLTNTLGNTSAAAEKVLLKSWIFN